MMPKLTELLQKGLIFTRNGKPLNRLISIPAGANNLHIHFSPGKIITSAWWTKDGVPILPLVKVPKDSNDLHLFL